MASYTVKAGDTVIGLALTNGFKSADDILNDSGNSSLKKSRTDPGVLLPGDTVTIPSRVLREEPSAIDASHKFVATRPKAWVRLVVKDALGVALAGKAYQLTIDGKLTSGTVPDGGIIERAVPPTAKSGQLTVFLSDKPNDVEIWMLQLGWMDPIDSITGVQARLINLGYDIGHEPNGVLDDATKFAICAFQARIGVDQTGAIDDTLQQKLASYYDPAQDETTQDATPAATTDEDSGAEDGSDDSASDADAASDDSASDDSASDDSASSGDADDGGDTAATDDSSSDGSDTSDDSGADDAPADDTGSTPSDSESSGDDASNDDSASDDDSPDDEGGSDDSGSDDSTDDDDAADSGDDDAAS